MSILEEVVPELCLCDIARQMAGGKGSGARGSEVFQGQRQAADRGLLYQLVEGGRVEDK